ncbi:hypothetical protein RAS1_43980 [Phycisphaerae bacterium RAS1]|nr:hypothetical protein RAS1_43980 [Phycisphaerae bacterium RAS1]
MRSIQQQRLVARRRAVEEMLDRLVGDAPPIQRPAPLDVRDESFFGPGEPIPIGVCRRCGRKLARRQMLEAPHSARCAACRSR